MAGKFEAILNGHHHPPDPVEPVSSDSSEVVDTRVDLSADESTMSSSSFKESDHHGNDSAFYEKFLLDDLDSYWDDLNTRLTVSRMVSDAVIMGMVNAVVEEAAEKIASNETEMIDLNDRLKSYESAVAGANKLQSCTRMPEHLMSKLRPQISQLELKGTPLCASLEQEFSQDLAILRTMVEEQLQRLAENIKNVSCPSYHRGQACSADMTLCYYLPEGKTDDGFLGVDKSIVALKAALDATFERVDSMLCSFNAAFCDLQWENEFEREISNIMFQENIKGLYDGFEEKLCAQTSLIHSLKEDWQKKAEQLSTMRQELDAMSRSFVSWEHGSLQSHNSIEAFEDWTTVKRKDNIPRNVLGSNHLPHATQLEDNGPIPTKNYGDSGMTMLEVADSPQLRTMSKEEVISYYKTEITSMRRQHDSALQEKTEELFRVKREYLREKDSLHFRKDKEFEVLRKKIPEVILKLDDILLKNEKFPTAHGCHDELRSLRNRIDTLYSENQHLLGLLTNQQKEVMSLSSQVSDAACQMTLHSSTEENFMKQIKNLERDMEDLEIESIMRGELFNCILRENIHEQKIYLEDIEIKNKILPQVYCTIFRGVIDDAFSNLNAIVSRQYMEKTSLEELLSRKEKTLKLEIEENKKLKQAVSSLSTLMKEKEKSELEAGSTLNKQKKRFDEVFEKLNVLRDQLSKQEVLISQKNVESDSLRSTLDDTFQQLDQYDIEISMLNEKLKISSDTLEEAEKRNNMLCSIIEEKQKTLSSSLKNHEEEVKEMDSIANSVMGLSKLVADVEKRLAKSIDRNESRLTRLNHQINPLLQQGSLLKKKQLWYRQMLEMRCSNLQKAEGEVDLLGDEVDALLSLLGKIYIALDHYSPVLQHYPGVMEILKLVQRELKGESTKLV